jgi:hypothetical protein
MQDMGFVLYDSLVKKSKSNVEIIPPKKKGHAVIHSVAVLNGILDPFEYSVLSAVVFCKPHGFNATQLRYFFRAGAESLGNALNRLIEMNIVVRDSYQVYDSGFEGIGKPRLEYDYMVDYGAIELLLAHKKEKLSVPLLSIEPVRVPVKLPQQSIHRANGSENETIRPAPAMDAPSYPATAIPSGTRAINNKNGTIHDCHLSHKAVVNASNGYEPDQKEKLDMFINKLARDGNILPDIDTFCERFNAYLDVCYEKEAKWAELNGVLKIPSKNSRALNGLLRTLREPYNTVTYEQYELKFFALMNIQNQVVDKNSVVFVNDLRDIYNKGGLERYFYALPKKAPN